MSKKTELKKNIGYYSFVNRGPMHCVFIWSVCHWKFKPFCDILMWWSGSASIHEYNYLCGGSGTS